MEMEMDDLSAAVQEDAAIRRTQRLQPSGGRGDKIFPPTYPPERRGGPPRHVFERRRMDDGEVWCVLVDSRPESGAIGLRKRCWRPTGDAGMLPYITVNFRGAGLEPLERITSLDAPHRVYSTQFCGTPSLEWSPRS